MRYRPRFTRNCLNAALAAALFAAAAAAPLPSQEAGQEGATFKVAVSLVTLGVSVRNPQGAPVRGLPQSAFTVCEDGQPQDIVHFSEEKTPSGIVLLLDTSSSMEGPQLEEARRAALEFVAHSQPEDEIALISFNDKVEVLQQFTSDKERLHNAIMGLRASGGTALYDAIVRGVELMPSSRYPRHVLVVFSDGVDADSRRRFSDVEKVVQTSDLVLFAVGEYLGPERKLLMTGARYYKEPPLEVNYNPVWVLRQLAEIAGGSAVFPEPDQPLAPFFGEIAKELQDQYVIAYASPPPSAEPKWRSIEVRLSSAGAQNYKIRTRKGYLSPGLNR